MKKLILTFIFILSLYKINYGEPFFCFPNTNFTVSSLAHRAGISGSFKVIFDVINFKVANIKINSLDSTSSIQLFQKSIEENLEKLIFLKDTLNAKLILKFIITPVWKINHDYAESVSDDEIHFVFRGAQIDQIIDYLPVKYPAEIDTLFVDSFVKYIPGTSSKPSDILVERIFKNDKDTSIIRINNHPKYTSEILKVSQLYTKEYFTSLVPKIKFYFIRFKIIRGIPECKKKYTF